MSAAPDFGAPGPAASRGPFQPRAGRKGPARWLMLPEEPQWWAAAPLQDGRRDLHELPPGALDALVRRYLPFVVRGLERYSRVLAVYLGDAEDIAGQAALWLLEAMRTYAADGAPFASYLARKVPRWVQDAARMDGRYLAQSESGHARTVRRFLADHHRLPTLAEEAAEFGEDETATAERLRAIAIRHGIRNALDPEMIDVDALPIAVDGGLWVCLPGPDGAGADARLLALEEARVLTAALVYAAADDAEPPNARGWWTLLLEQLDGYCRADLARAGHVGRKGIVDAQQALLAAARTRLTEAD